MDFAMPLDGRGPGSGEPSGIILWGKGYLNQLDVDDDRVPFDGDVTGAMLGLDFRMKPDFLLGFALNVTSADMDWNHRSEEITGSHELDMQSLHPYFGWQLAGGGRLWGSIGIGQGEVDVLQDPAEGAPAGQRSPNDLEGRELGLRTLSLGSYNPLMEREGMVNVRFGLIAEGSYASIWESEDDEFASGTLSAGWLRAGMEVGFDHALALGGRLDGSFELTYRQDFGDAATGSGLELGSGLDFVMPQTGLRFDLNFRTLLMHNTDFDDWGISGGVMWQAREGGYGPSVSFRPEWGALASSHERLWQGELAMAGAERYGGLPREAVGRYSLEVKYGIPVLRTRELLTLFARGNVADARQTYGLGAEFHLGTSFSAGIESVFVEQLTAGSAPQDDHRLYLRYERGF